MQVGACGRASRLAEPVLDPMTVRRRLDLSLTSHAPPVGRSRAKPERLRARRCVPMSAEQRAESCGQAGARILTVGHSTRTLAQLVALLAENGVALLADVRKLRGSRAFPHFGEAPLRRALARASIEYEPISELAGRRPKSKDPRPHPCWRNASFRNYADHMRTPEFRRGVRRLLALARRGRVAVMCAEAVPWRCHRSLIADWLVVEEEKPVEDVVGTARRPHRLTACARRVHGHLSYQLPRAMHDGLALERGHHDDG